MKTARAKLENRIILPFTFLLLAAIVIAAAGVFLFLHREMKEKLRREIANAARIEKVGTAGAIERLVFAAGVIADDERTKNALSGAAAPAASPADAAAFLAEKAGQAPLDSVSLLTKHGEVIASFSAEREAAEAPATPHFLDRVFRQAVENRDPAGKPVGGAAGGVDFCLPHGLCLQAIAPVASGRQIIGYVRAAQPLDDAYAKKFRETTGAEILILKQNLLIASSIPAAGFPLEQIDRLAAQLPDKVDDAEPPQLFTLESGNDIYMLQPAPLLAPGGEVVAWKLIGKSAGDIVRSWRRTLGILALVTIAMIPLSVAAGIATARRIVRPLKNLLEGVRQITRGELELEVPLSGTREIDELASSFNEMARALEERQRRLREAAEELKRNQEQIIQSGKLAAIGELAAGVAHEIGNPLSAISGYAQMLRRDVKDKEQLKDFMAEIEKEADFIERIIRDLLDFSRPAPPHFERMNLEDSIESALRTVSTHPAFDKIKIEKHYDSLPPISGNPKELAQVFLNLIMNAFQAMPGGGALTISTTNGGDFVAATVADTGPGIPADIRGKIFDPFFTTRPPGQGTGLGLAISYSIIEKHKGKIEAESKEGGGTTFRIELPVGEDTTP